MKGFVVSSREQANVQLNTLMLGAVWTTAEFDSDSKVQLWYNIAPWQTYLEANAGTPPAQDNLTLDITVGM